MSYLVANYMIFVYSVSKGFYNLCSNKVGLKILNLFFKANLFRDVIYSINMIKNLYDRKAFHSQYARLTKKQCL